MTARGNSQNGNVFFIIFLAIAMFAALTYAVMQGSRAGVSTLTADQARLAAQEIIDYGDTIQKAVQTLRLRGCSMAEISFDDTHYLSKQAGGSSFGYYNPNSPTDGSCHVFGPNGGKVNAKLLSQGYIPYSQVTDSTHLAPDSYQITMIRWYQAGNENWDSSGTDIVLWIGRLKPEVCLKINDTLGIQNQGAPPIDTYDAGWNNWQGTMLGNNGDALGDNPILVGKKSFCSGTDASGENYTYYQLLYAN